jgi:large subunit ribosomal protein L18
MNRLAHKRQNSSRRSARTRKAILVNSDRPRLSVHISNIHISAQVIDDKKGITLASATTVGKSATGSKTDKAAQVGKEIGQSAKKAKIKAVAFDRGGRKYHGRLRALAEAARKEGLEF